MSSAWLLAGGDVCNYHFVNDELMYGCIHGIDVKWIFCLIETYKILCGIIHHILSADKLLPAQIHFPAPAPALPATGQGWILCQYLQLLLFRDETYLTSSRVHIRMRILQQFQKNIYCTDWLKKNQNSAHTAALPPLLPPPSPSAFSPRSDPISSWTSEGYPS